MTGPDIRSAKGQANEVHTEKAYSVLLAHYRVPGAKLERLHDTHSADAIIRTPEGRALALLEVKCRQNFDEPEFWQAPFNGLWLISNSKLLENIPYARELGVPFYGVMHIVRSKVILVKTISTATGVVAKHTVRKCGSQASINGGYYIKDNAFLPMIDAKRLWYV